MPPPVCNAWCRRISYSTFFLRLCSITPTGISSATLQAQKVIIPAILGTMFGMLVLLAVLATLLVAFCHLRSGGFFLVLFWIWVLVICIIGPGNSRHTAMNCARLFLWSEFTCRNIVHRRLPHLRGLED